MDQNEQLSRIEAKLDLLMQHLGITCEDISNSKTTSRKLKSRSIQGDSLFNQQEVNQTLNSRAHSNKSNLKDSSFNLLDSKTQNDSVSDEFIEHKQFQQSFYFRRVDKVESSVIKFWIQNRQMHWQKSSQTEKYISIDNINSLQQIKGLLIITLKDGKQMKLQGREDQILQFTNDLKR